MGTLTTHRSIYRHSRRDFPRSSASEEAATEKTWDARLGDGNEVTSSSDDVVAPTEPVG